MSMFNLLKTDSIVFQILPCHILEAIYIFSKQVE